MREAKDGELQKLRKRVKRLEKDKIKLLSEVKTLEAYFKKTQMHVEGLTGSEPVEKLIKAAQSGKRLKNIKEEPTKITCKKCTKGEVNVRTIPLGIMHMCQNKECNHVEVEKNKSTTEDTTEG